MILQTRFVLFTRSALITTIQTFKRFKAGNFDLKDEDRRLPSSDGSYQDHIKNLQYSV